MNIHAHYICYIDYVMHIWIYSNLEKKRKSKLKFSWFESSINSYLHSFSIITDSRHKDNEWDGMGWNGSLDLTQEYGYLLLNTRQNRVGF